MLIPCEHGVYRFTELHAISLIDAARIHLISFSRYINEGESVLGYPEIFQSIIGSLASAEV